MPHTPSGHSAKFSNQGCMQERRKAQQKTKYRELIHHVLLFLGRGEKLPLNPEGGNLSSMYIQPLAEYSIDPFHLKSCMLQSARAFLKTLGMNLVKMPTSSKIIQKRIKEKEKNGTSYDQIPSQNMQHCLCIPLYVLASSIISTQPSPPGVVLCVSPHSYLTSLNG